MISLTSRRGHSEKAEGKPCPVVQDGLNQKYMYSASHTHVQMLGIMMHIQNLCLSKTITYAQQLWGRG